MLILLAFEVLSAVQEGLWQTPHIQMNRKFHSWQRQQSWWQEVESSLGKQTHQSLACLPMKLFHSKSRSPWLAKQPLMMFEQ